MNHEHNQKALRIFQIGIKLSPEEKQQFFDRECDDDVELRKNVERLFDESNSGSEMAEPKTSDDSEPVESLTPSSNEVSNENRQFGNYKILNKIGEGGMGEVFLALDKNLERKVALKLLSPKFTNDETYLQRFKQEARAASALNHPYILSIFEFGETDGVHFIASEYIAGQTLNRYCSEDEPDLLHKLDILVRIGSALSAAHEAGIVHRDIKPENIIVRPDGYVKVLDFGLAKLIETYNPGPNEPEASTLPLVKTNPGLVMGTASYMSPEQAKAKNIDARSDIFSFGVVIYETVAGHLPFKGGSALEIIAAILHTEPKPLNDDEVPHEIKRIIDKCLKKDRDERYQTIKDLVLDLKEARRELEFQQKLGRSFPPESVDAKTELTRGREGTETAVMQVAQNTERFDKNNRKFLFRSIVIALLASIAGISIWWFVSSPAQRNGKNETFASFKSFEITNWANAAGELSTSASFSPDGKFVAYGSTKTGTTSVWVKQTSGGDAIQVTKDEFYNHYPIWSPNGEEVVYYSSRGDTRGLWRVSLMGGQQKLVTENIDKESKPRLWSKSEKIYFQGAYNLSAVDLRSGEVSQITDFSTSESPVRTIKVAPDESKIAYLVIENGNWKINVKPLGDGQITQIFESKNPIDNLVWYPDGTKLLFSEKTSEFYEINSIDLKIRNPVSISSADNDSFVQDVSSDGSRILYSSATETSDLWKVDRTDGAESLVASEKDAELWADVSADSSSVVYQSIKNLRQGSNLQNGLIMSKSIGREDRPVQLAEGGFLPQWSSDGKTVAYLKPAGRNLEIWKVASTGDLAKRISELGVEGLEYSISPYIRNQVKHISWSPKESILAFPATRDGISNIWMVSSDGSGEKAVSNNSVSDNFYCCPIWANEGKKIAFSSFARQRIEYGKRIYTIWIYDFETGVQKKILDTQENIKLLGWTVPNEEVVFAVKNYNKTFTLTPPEVPIRAVSIESDATRDLTILKDAYFGNIYLSNDGKSIAYTSRMSGNDDVWISPLERGEPRRLTANNDPRLYYSSLVWSPNGNSIFFGKQTRFTLLSMLINQKGTEEKDEN